MASGRLRLTRAPRTGVTIAQWHALREAYYSSLVEMYVSPRQIAKQAVRRDNAEDRRRGVFYGHHFLANQEPGWAAAPSAKSPSVWTAQHDVEARAFVLSARRQSLEGPGRLLRTMWGKRRGGKLVDGKWRAGADVGEWAMISIALRSPRPLRLATRKETRCLKQANPPRSMGAGYLSVSSRD